MTEDLIPSEETITVDQLIASTSTKPFVNPTTPVQPISEPEPVNTTTGATEAPATAPPNGATAKPVTNTTPVKNQTPAKTATTPAKKPGIAKKAVAKTKRTA